MLIVLLRGKRDLVVMETVCKLCCLIVSLNLFEVEFGGFLFWVTGVISLNILEQRSAT